MNFDEILEQVIALLKRQGRVSYRALKMRFEEIDDEYLDVLKEELIDAQRLATDEDGRIMVWAGETGEVPEPTSQLDQTPQLDTQEAQPTPVESPLAEPHTPDAERRQLTVMFVDMVDSTMLSSQLDPEDYREVVREYQQVCSEVIQRYDGHVAQLLGDGLLVYFGYPQAHEDDAQRAIHTGLGIVEAIRSLNTGLEQEKGIKLAVRLGIHTGLAVVGEMGGEGRQEQLALGETPNVAARIQGLAQPNTVVISDATHRLVQGYFDAEPLGEHDLRGVAQPIAVYRVLDDRGIQSRLDVASSRGLTPLVGRESETTLLFERWAQAKDGQGQVVLLSGEAGIGKSRLVQVLKDHVSEGPHTRLECRSSPYFTNSALYPITDMIQRTLRFQADDTPEQKLEELIENLRHYRLPLEETVPLFGTLLSLPVPEDRYPPLNLSPQRQRQKTLEAIVAIILELAEYEPVLFILEDLHWTDPTTLELLELLIDQTPTASLCVFLTCRSEFQPGWSHRSYLSELSLNRLSHPQIEQIATQVAGGKTLPAEIIQQLVDKTDGVPLYVEEMTKAVLESRLLKEVDGKYELTGPVSSLSIPATLQDSLMSRLDRLVTAKAVAQYASVIGRQFSYELLQAVSELDGATLQRELGRLVDAELVYQRGVVPGATYIFKHALIQDTAYESLLRSTRQGYHRRIAEVLEERFPERAENQPELLAHHYTEAGLHEQALDCWYKAGQHASERSAHVEAINHLHKGLELLKTLPNTPEFMQVEVKVLISLGPALMAAKEYGATEVEQVYTNARTLCEQLGDTSQLIPVLLGLGRFYRHRAALHTSRELGEQVLTLTQHVPDNGFRVLAHLQLGVTLCNLGAFEDALTHLEQGLALYAPQHHGALVSLYGDEPEIAVLTYIGFTHWHMGYPEKALKHLQKALTLAQQLPYPFSQVYALVSTAWCHLYRREAQEAQVYAEATIALSTEQGFPLREAQSTILCGWALVMQGETQAGMTQMQQGLTTLYAMGTQVNQTVFLAWLAEAYGTLNQPEEGLTVLTEAQALIEKNEERWYEAELHRLKGALLLQQSPDNATEAETCFHQAITIAQSQQAKSWELRAATSLARLWQSQGKREEARELLEPVYSWFTEGFDTADLIDAKALLDELA